MRKLEVEEMKKISAGGVITATFIAALSKAASVVIDIGRYFGSSINRFINGNICE